MPPPHRLEGELVTDLLDRWFPEGRTIVPSVELSRDIVRRCSENAIQGGSVYDALVGLTSAEAGTTLLTRDLRAARAYRRLGVDIDLAG
jgi:hypothetical protein